LRAKFRLSSEFFGSSGNFWLSGMLYVSRRALAPAGRQLPMPARSRAALLAAFAAAASALAPAAASAADYRPGEVVVRYAKPGATAARNGTTAVPKVRVVHTRKPVAEKIADLRRRPGVLSATPNYVAHASGFIPNDPGPAGGPAGGWQSIQWNFLDGTGVNAPDAWQNLINVGRPGASGVTVAVLDTGIAYRNYGRFRRSPDFTARLHKGYDFVDNDPYPLDLNGHGTHVASTIAEAANNGIALTGLAYGATIMPVRVLDRLGEGDSVAISRGIRYAARRGAKVINLSFEFSSSVRAGQIPDILDALRYAQKRGVLIVGASGNASSSDVAYPARASHVLSVGAITEHGCQADYSNTGPGLDLSAPGGGADADIPDPNCHPDDAPGHDVVQMTFAGSVRKFGLPTGYMGTSMAAPHVTATAAMVIASGVIGPDPTPAAIEKRLKDTADDLGKPGPDSRYGWGKVDAARATAPAPPSA
jgi:serine protease